MKKTITNFKNNIFLKFYSVFLFLGNTIYLYCEIYKDRYIKNIGLDFLSTSMRDDQYEYILNISKTTSLLEYLITLIVFIYWIYIVIAIVQKDEIRTKVQNFLVLNFILLVILAFISYLTFLFSSIPIGNVLQQLFGPIVLVFLVLIYFIVSFFHEKLHRFN